MKTFNKKYVSLITIKKIDIIIDFIFVSLLLKHQKSLFVIMSCVERVCLSMTSCGVTGAGVHRKK